MRREANLSLPKLAFVVMTRAALGAGVGLLASASLPKRSRKKLGASLLTVGAVTTLPALWLVFGGGGGVGAGAHTDETGFPADRAAS